MAQREDDYLELYAGYRSDIDDDWADAGRELEDVEENWHV